MLYEVITNAIKLLKAWGGQFTSDDTISGQICELVGYLPLAVRLAGRYLSHRKQQAKKYLAWLQESPLRCLNHGKRRDQSVPLLLERSLMQVSAEARMALSVSGQLELQSFDENVIANALDITSFDADQCLGELVNYSLLKPSGETGDRYEVTHPLIHTYARTELLPDEEVFRRLVIYLNNFTREQSEKGLEGYARLDLV